MVSTTTEIGLTETFCLSYFWTEPFLRPAGHCTLNTEHQTEYFELNTKIIFHIFLDDFYLQL